MYTVDLSANVPLYGQEQCTWCGPASGQMARNGYPSPADRLLYAQLSLWNSIHVYNSKDPADAAWATDPHGLTGCLQSLSNPAGVDWVEFADPDQGVVLFDILFWMNQYVAVVEPPSQEGRVSVRRETRTGRRLVSPARALAQAGRWIAEMHLADRSSYSLLGREDVEALEPMLVREERPGEDVRSVPYYYIVPFGFRAEVGERGVRMARAAVLVNAYTGRFEEVTAFGKPVRYLPREEALDVVAAATRMERDRLNDAGAALMFRPSDITHVRTWPFWQVKLADLTLYVDQLGQLYGRILPSVPGD